MLKSLLSYLFAAGGKISKTKIAALIIGLYGAAKALGYVHLTPEQETLLMSALATFFGLSLRDAVQKSGPEE